MIVFRLTVKQITEHVQKYFHKDSVNLGKIVRTRELAPLILSVKIQPEQPYSIYVKSGVQPHLYIYNLYRWM